MRWVSLTVQVLLAIALLLGAVALAFWWTAVGGGVPVWLAWIPGWMQVDMPFIYGIVATVAVVDAIQLGVRGDVRSLARGAVIAKLSAIPFFVVNFLGAVLIAVVALVRGGPVVALVVPVMVVGTFCIMLPTSAYGIAALLRLRRDRVVGHGFLWPHLVLHVVFVLDVLSSILVAARVRRLTREMPVGAVARQPMPPRQAPAPGV